MYTYTFLISVPPNEVEFMDEKGMRVQGEIGPYMVGDTLVITCDVLGGKYWRKGSLHGWRSFNHNDILRRK